MVVMNRVCSWVAAVAVVVGLVGVGAGEASAQASFDALHGEAAEVTGQWGLGALMWAQGDHCSKLTNDVDRRQCNGVKEGRLEQLEGATFLVVGDGGALSIGAYNEKTKSASVSIAPCLACEQPINVDGEELYVVGGSKFAVTGGKVNASAVKATTATWASQAKYDKYLQKVLPRLRSEFIVSVGKAKRWKKAGSVGVTVEVVGWRVYDPCKGKVIMSSPKSGDVSPDKRACGKSDEPKEPVATKPKDPPKPKKPKVPYKLTPFQINPYMSPVRKAAQKCFEAYGVAGKSTYSITFNNEGKIVKVVEKGDFKDTPTGTCIRKSIDGVVFGKMRMKSMSFDFPVVLQ